jgi:DNA-binding response OmpR family regulator
VGTTTPTVLVVDDDPGIRDSMARLLSVYGYSPLVAADLDEAIRALGEATVDAMIIDVRLGDGRTGLDLLHTIRAQPALANVPILVLTGAILSDAEEALITRMRAYLFQKPEGFHTLLDFLDTLTGRDQEH